MLIYGHIVHVRRTNTERISSVSISYFRQNIAVASFRFAPTGNDPPSKLCFCASYEFRLFHDPSTLLWNSFCFTLVSAKNERIAPYGRSTSIYVVIRLFTVYQTRFLFASQSRIARFHCISRNCCWRKSGYRLTRRHFQLSSSQ